MIGVGVCTFIGGVVVAHGVSFTADGLFVFAYEFWATIEKLIVESNNTRIPRMPTTTRMDPARTTNRRMRPLLACCVAAELDQGA